MAPLPFAMGYRGKDQADEHRIDVLEDDLEERDEEIADLKVQLEAARNPKPEPATPKDPAATRRRRAMFVVLGLATLGAATWVVMNRRSSETVKAADTAAKPDAISQATLRNFNFTMSPKQAAKHLEQAPGKRLRFDVADLGEVEILFRSEHDQIRIRSAHFRDDEKAKARLKELAPNRFHRNEVSRWGAFVRVGNAGYILDARSTWKTDNSAVIIDAFWAAGRYATLGGHKPTAAQLRILNGPTLAEVAGIDINVPIEQARMRLGGTVPYANCGDIFVPERKASHLACQIDLNHPAFNEATLLWTNSTAAPVYGAHVAYQGNGRHDQAGSNAHKVRRCLEDATMKLPAKGAPEVTDHATGDSTFVWKIDATAHMVVHDNALYIGSAMQPGEKHSEAWIPHFGAVMKALNACGR